jgi:hypothetical protein
MISRYSDVWVRPNPGDWPPLPVVDWQRIGKAAPVRVPVAYQGPDAPLPRADVVVMTWTSAEWSAFDHVFLNSGTTRDKESTDWRHYWYQYSRGAPTVEGAPPSTPLWGLYQLVDIPGASGAPQRVLLFKCNAHLAHAPWFQGLTQMLQLILQDTQPSLILSIGTAGGTRPDVRLGDTVVTNAAHITLQKPENAGAGIDGQTFTSSGPFPSQDLYAQVQAQLMFRMSNVATYPALENALAEVHLTVPDSGDFGLEDLLNDALRPESLHDPRALPMPGTPLLTTDFYYIATGDDAAQYAVLEMDDAVIAYVAGQAGVDYAFFRNISDPIVPATTAGGTTIPDAVRDGWSGQIYKDFGLYTSYNGALATWASLAAR